MIQTAHAETDHYEFVLHTGTNVLNLNTTYNSNYVTNISEFFGHHDYVYYRIETQYEIGLPHTYALEVDKEEGMNDDYSNVWFEYANGTQIPFFKYEKYNSSKAVFFVYLENTQHTQDVYLKHSTGATPNQSDTRVFLNYINAGNSSVSGSHYVSITGRNSSSLYPSSTNNASNLSFILSYQRKGRYATDVSNGALYSPSNSRVVNYNVYNFTIGGKSLSGINGTYLYIMNLNKIGGGNFTRFQTNYNSNIIESTAFNMGNSLRFYAPDVSPVYNRIVYTFKTTEATITKLSGSSLISPVAIDIPPGNFSSISFDSENSGVLQFSITYSPHIVPLTPDGSVFQENAQLLFSQNPSTFATEYQIAVDSNFFGIVDSDLTRSGSSSVSVALPPGNYYWHMQQADGSYTEPLAFTVETAPPIDGHLNFRIVNELTNANVSATVILSNNTTTLQKTGANVTFNSTEVTAGNYTVQIKQNNYSTRYYEVESPGNYIFYLLQTNLTTNNASVVYFSLIDNTNTFQYDSTKLEIIKQTPNGSILIQNSYFDASGFVVATLNQFDNYILKVVSDSGHERILGNYIQAGQTTTQLVISDIDLKDSNMSVHAGFRYNLTKSDEAVKFDWLNPNNSLKEPLLFQIYKNNELVMNISTGAPFGSINYYDNVAGEMKLDPDATYRIVMTAKTANGTIKINEYYKVGEESVGIDFEKIPLALRIVISLILLILVASMFNITNAKFSAIVVTLVAGFLALVGFLPILSSVLIWLLFVAIVAYKTNNR